MKTNSDLTIYHKSVDSSTRTEVWTAYQVNQILWENRKAANVIRSGLLEADSVAVYVPFARELPDDLKPGDVLVKGLVYDQIDSSFTISDLKRKYTDVVVVRSVDRMDYGSLHLQHWQIGAA